MSSADTVANGIADLLGIDPEDVGTISLSGVPHITLTVQDAEVLLSFAKVGAG